MPIRLPKIPRIRRTPRRGPEPGSRPGTLATRVDLAPPTITRIEFDEAAFDKLDCGVEELDRALRLDAARTVWVDVQGVGDGDMLRRFGEALNLHLLTIEDIAHVHQRPKVESFEEYLFTTLRAVRVGENGDVENEQLSMILRGNVLVTFQERPGDGFDPVRRRLRENLGPIRRRGADYLYYALLDCTIDNYFPVLETFGDTMEQLEEQIRTRPTPQLSQAVHSLRREFRQLRRAAWPLREVAATLSRGGLERLDPSLQPSFRDCYDHVVHVADFVEGSRERASDLASLYQTMVSERANQVMKVLTIMATVFIPLTFLCGLYGMNFDADASPYNMPELRLRYGYPAFWGVMIVTVLGMLGLFWRKGWIGGAEDRD